MPAKKNKSFYLKLGISAFLLGYVFTKVGWEEFIDTLRKTDPLFVFLNFAISPVLIFVSVLKWWVLLRAKAMNVPLPRLCELYLVGNFFTQLLPSNVGGDVVRGYTLGKDTGRLGDVLASVFLERMTGFTVLLLYALLVLSVNVQLLGDTKVAVTVASAFVGYLGVLWVALDPRLLAMCTPKMRFPFLTKSILKLQKFQAAIQAYRDSSEVWLPVIALSIAFYLLAVVNVYLGCLAFSTRVPLTTLAMAVPIILVISMVPISPGSLGLNEWAYFVVFEFLGVSGTLGLSVALLIRAKGITFAGIGGLFYARWLTRSGTRDAYTPTWIPER